jgi:hypothetical protein
MKKLRMGTYENKLYTFDFYDNNYEEKDVNGTGVLAAKKLPELLDDITGPSRITSPVRDTGVLPLGNTLKAQLEKAKETNFDIENILNQSLTQKNMSKFATKYKYIQHLNKNLSSVIAPDELVLYSMTNSFNLDNVPPKIRHIYVDAKNGMLHLNNQKVNFLNHTGKGIVFDNGFQNKNTFKVDGAKQNFVVKSECDCIITIEYTSRDTAWIWVAVAIIVLILILIYYYEYSTNNTTTISVTK